MAWELLAILLIVAVAVTWFVRDEKRARADAEIERAARYYAHAPKYRHVSAEPVALPTAPVRPRTGGLSSEQRAFIEAFKASRSRSRA